MAQYLDLEGAKVIVNKIKEGDNRTYIKNLNSGSGKDGYMSIALITITGQYVNQPIEIKVLQRTKFGTIIILFNNYIGNDPDLNYIKKTGDINAYIVKKSAGLWELYVKKNEAYDSIDIVELYKGGYMNKVDVKWNNGFVESLPAGCSEAKLMEMDTAGNSATATKLATARTIALSGSVTGSGSFDGSGNLSIATTTNHTHTKSQITDMPTSLKNPTALTVQFNGTTDKTYDGSSAQTVNITPGGIGAYTKGEVDNKISPLSNNVNQLSNPNLLINGDFQVWQRGTEFNCKETVTYTADRWVFAGDTLPKAKKTEKGISLSTTKVGTWSNFCYKLEDDFLNRLVGKKLTLTFKTSSPTNDINLIWCNGRIADDKEIYHVQDGSVGGKTTDTFSVTFDVKQKTIKSELGIQLKSDKVGRTIELLWAKLELGDKATPFVPRVYEEELALCQRYYEVSDSDIAIPGIKNNLTYFIDYEFKTVKRIPPTIEVNNLNANNKVYLCYPNHTGLVNVKQCASTEKRVRIDMDFISNDNLKIGSPIIGITCVKADAEIY